MRDLKFFSKEPQILDQLKAIRKLQKIGNYNILEDSNTSTCWIVDDKGLKIRSVCGYHSPRRGICLQPAGSGTEHKGYGRCIHHSYGPLYNTHLSREHNYPARFIELYEQSLEFEEGILAELDTEIRTLYALQNYIMTYDRQETDELTLTEIERIQEIVRDLIKAKVQRSKIKRQMRLDAGTVKEFVDTIFKIIVRHESPQKAKMILDDVMNSIQIGFRNQDKMSGNINSIRKQIEKNIEQ